MPCLGLDAVPAGDTHPGLVLPRLLAPLTTLRPPFLPTHATFAVAVGLHPDAAAIPDPPAGASVRLTVSDPAGTVLATRQLWPVPSGLASNGAPAPAPLLPPDGVVALATFANLLLRQAGMYTLQVTWADAAIGRLALPVRAADTSSLTAQAAGYAPHAPLSRPVH